MTTNENKEPQPLGNQTHSEERTRLECAKLQAEIDSIRLPFYRSTGFYIALAPVLLGLIGLAFTYFSGWFDNQNKLIAAQTEKLAAQNEQLETRKTLLDREAKEQQARVEATEAELSELKKERSILVNQLSSLTNQLGLLGRERDEMKQTIAILEREGERLAGSDTNALRLLTELKASRQDFAGYSRSMWISA